MAEVRKNNNKYSYSVVKEKKIDKKVAKKEFKDSSNNKNNKTTKNSLWVRFRIFAHGVVSETKKVHWPKKDELIKYSIATIFLVVVMSVFFYIIDIIFAAVQSLLN